MKLVSPADTVIAHVVTIKGVARKPRLPLRLPAPRAPAEPEVIKKGKKEEEAAPEEKEQEEDSGSCGGGNRPAVARRGLGKSRARVRTHAA